MTDTPNALWNIINSTANIEKELKDGYCGKYKDHSFDDFKAEINKVTDAQTVLSFAQMLEMYKVRDPACQLEILIECLSMQKEKEEIAAQDFIFFKSFLQNPIILNNIKKMAKNYAEKSIIIESFLLLTALSDHDYNQIFNTTIETIAQHCFFQEFYLSPDDIVYSSMLIESIRRNGDLLISLFDEIVQSPILDEIIRVIFKLELVNPFLEALDEKSPKEREDIMKNVLAQLKKSEDDVTSAKLNEVYNEWFPQDSPRRHGSSSNMANCCKSITKLFCRKTKSLRGGHEQLLDGIELSQHAR